MIREPWEQRLMIYRPTTQDDFSASQCIFRFRAEISISKNKVQFCGFFTKTMIQNITEGTKLNQRLGAITATLLALAGKPASFVTDLLQSQESLGGRHYSLGHRGEAKAGTAHF